MTCRKTHLPENSKNQYVWKWSEGSWEGPQKGAAWSVMSQQEKMVFSWGTKDWWVCKWYLNQRRHQKFWVFLKMLHYLKWKNNTFSIVTCRPCPPWVLYGVLFLETCIVNSKIFSVFSVSHQGELSIAFLLRSAWLTLLSKSKRCWEVTRVLMKVNGTLSVISDYTNPTLLFAM